MDLSGLRRDEREIVIGANRIRERYGPPLNERLDEAAIAQKHVLRSTRRLVVSLIAQPGVDQGQDRGEWTEPRAVVFCAALETALMIHRHAMRTEGITLPPPELPDAARVALEAVRACFQRHGTCDRTWGHPDDVTVQGRIGDLVDKALGVKHG